MARNRLPVIAWQPAPAPKRAVPELPSLTRAQLLAERERAERRGDGQRVAEIDQALATEHHL